MTVRYALFDLGRVVLDWEPSRLYEKIFPDADQRDWFLTHVCDMDWHTRHDAGLTFMQGRVDLIAKYPAYQSAIEAWGHRWMEMFNGYVPGTPDVLASLKARGVPLFALSNMSIETWPWHLEAFPALHVFEHVVVSGEVKMHKPNADIYHYTLEKMGRPDPQTVLFIDDSLPNIEAADALGFQTHHFTGGSAALKADLSTRGLI